MRTISFPAVYVADNCDGTYDAFVLGAGFRANSRLPECLDFIRHETGRTQGAVPCLNRERCEWDSEFDLREGV